MRALTFFLVSIVASNAATAATGDVAPNKVCESYASTMTFAGSLERTMERLPFAAKQQKALEDYFAKNKAEIPFPEFVCSGTVLTVSGKKSKYLIDFAPLESNRILVNGTSLTLSTTRDVSDLMRWVREQTTPPSAPVKSKKKSAALSLAIQEASAQTRPVWSIQRDEYNDRIYVGVIAASAGSLNFGCRGNEPLRDRLLQTWSRGLRQSIVGCEGLKSAELFAWTRGFEKFDFVCRDGKVREISWGFRDHSLRSRPTRTVGGRPAPGTQYDTRITPSAQVITTTLKFQYDDQRGSLARIEKRASTSPNRVCALNILNNEVLNSEPPTNPDPYDTDAYRNYHRCFSNDYHAEIRGSGEEIYENEYREEAQSSSLRRDRIKGGVATSVLNDLNIDSISPLSRIDLVTECCADTNCPAEVRRMREDNQPAPAPATSRPPATK